MRIHWYANDGGLLDTRWPESLCAGIVVCKALTKLCGFAVLESEKCKFRWFSKGHQVQNE